MKKIRKRHTTLKREILQNVEARYRHGLIERDEYEETKAFIHDSAKTTKKLMKLMCKKHKACND
jgi:outer membrane protein TolC